jgi:hypothetical protein
MGPNTGYKFKLVEGSNTIEVTSTNHVLPTYTIPNFKYGVTYTVSVALKNSNNEYGGYGPTCSISTTAPTISNASCGSTVGYFANILATPMGPNTGYKFKVVEGANTYEITSTNHVLPTFNIPNFKYGVTYTVSVALKNSNNEYGGYGPTCTFNTTAPTISNASCGSTVGYYANILATPMGPNTGYKFKLVNGSTTIEVTSTNHVLPVYSIPGIQPSTIYSVSVALKNANNEYGGYGPACNVTTSAYNTVITSLTTLSCTTSTYPSNGLSVITANEVNGAVAYRFKFEVAGGTSSFYLYSTTSSLDMFTAGLPTGDYNVSVAVATSASGATLSNYTYGTDGVACLIKYTAPASPMTLSDDTAMNSLTDGEEETQSNVSVNEEESTLSEELWSVRASTNPYEENFFLRLDNANGLSSDAVFTVRILDLQGKLIEQRSVVASGLEEERYGDGLSSGMYLVTLTDGTRQQTLRVVKK